MDLIAIVVGNGKDVLRGDCDMVHFPGHDLLAAPRRRGLPIGNLTSQFFANVYLDPLDHFVRKELRETGYIRCCDDFVVFAESREHLEGVGRDCARRQDSCGRPQAPGRRGSSSQTSTADVLPPTGRASESAAIAACPAVHSLRVARGRGALVPRWCSSPYAARWLPGEAAIVTPACEPVPRRVPRG
jgi:hypothetical protein